MADLLVTHHHYPISIALYFKQALRKMGHRLWTAGAFTPTIPWASDKDFSHMLDIPDYVVEPSNTTFYPIDPILSACPFEPDAIISFDAGFACTGVNQHAIPNAIVLTDPHALPLHYQNSILHYDKIFCMQQSYMHEYEVDMGGNRRPVWWLPYAASEQHDYWNGTDFSQRPYDVCIISGLLYPQRKQALGEMWYAGVQIRQDVGVFFDEASEVYNQAVIAFNWSSQDDLCARFFEGLARRNLVLTNRVSDLKQFTELQEGVHYVAFDTMDECVEKAVYYSQNRDKAWEIASAGYAAWWAGNHSYIRRCETILDVLGVLS